MTFSPSHIYTGTRGARAHAQQYANMTLYRDDNNDYSNNGINENNTRPRRHCGDDIVIDGGRHPTRQRRLCRTAFNPRAAAAVRTPNWVVHFVITDTETNRLRPLSMELMKVFVKTFVDPSWTSY